MIITTLVENTTLSKEYTNKHGLSFHIKTKNHSILFDLGPDDSFIKNADKLNIDISEVDIVVISHGHSDHGGGLSAFLNHNKKAKIYIHKNAFGPYYAEILAIGKHYIGLDIKIQNDNRIVLTDDNFNIDDNIYLFSNIEGKELMPSSNKALLRREENKYVQDDFNHEQNLILKEDDKNILIAGCAHNGIINIIAKAEKIIGGSLDSTIGGFHLFDPISKKSDDTAIIEKISEILFAKNTAFYTCHCTGVEPFEILQRKLGNKITYLSTGQVIEI